MGESRDSIPGSAGSVPLQTSYYKTARAQFRRIWRTLRFRLAFMNALAVVLITLIMLGIVRQGVLWALYHELDQLLLEDMQEVSLALKDLKPDEFPLLREEFERKSLGHRQHGWFVELFNERGHVLWASEAAPTLREEASIAGSLQPFTQDGLRIVQAAAPPGVPGIAAVCVGAKLEFLDRDMARIDRLVVVAAAMLVVVAPLCGYWLAGRASHTVGDIIHTAARLRPSHLDERLKLRGTGDELDQLAHTINGLLDRIAAYLQQKRDFLANAAHELRTPLAAIRSSIEVSLEGHRLNQEDSSMLEDLIDQSTSLEVLVNQLLLISETEIGQWAHETEHVELHEVVARAVEMFQGVAEVSDIRLNQGAVCHATVPGSRRYLRQVVNNLIDNAVKYTRTGGKIVVSLEEVPHERRVKLTVKDTGVGIDPEDIPKVFDRFFRADRSRARTQSVQGTGLGLSICQAVVSAHEGTIRCQSVLNQGTTMEVFLPLTTEEAQSVDAGFHPATSGVQHSV
ncbi:sensor histidine kinase [Planctomicrobium piriforme]|uniref:histidine kinase n=1 Tax=Planctomicrobium piriforme TaxID=1576369 RepID=A0A1I3HNP3_9PLAN|nr:HAMP domain-containing sensor histidine kinase [Planctomicrobium piriforme]SFI37301.1 Signal transduction histidine kinase [Planctomicrobium piriforme]